MPVSCVEILAEMDNPISQIVVEQANNIEYVTLVDFVAVVINSAVAKLSHKLTVVLGWVI